VGKSLKMLIVGLLFSFTVVTAQQFPLWERMLRYYGGKSDDTPVLSMKMGNQCRCRSRASRNREIKSTPSGSSPPLAAWLHVTPT